MKCEKCGEEMVQLGYLGKRGGFYPLRNPTRYFCLRCGIFTTLRLMAKSTRGRRRAPHG